jgi:hypothetical protein
VHSRPEDGVASLAHVAHRSRKESYFNKMGGQAPGGLIIVLMPTI